MKSTLFKNPSDHLIAVIMKSFLPQTGSPMVVIWFLLFNHACTITGSLEFRTIQQNSTTSTFKCSYKGAIEHNPHIIVKHNGKPIGYTHNSTDLTLTTSTPLCEKEKHFSCSSRYQNDINEKTLRLLPSHDELDIALSKNGGLQCLQSNQMVTVWCIVRNLCSKDKVHFTASNDYEKDNEETFHAETYSIFKERRYLGIVAAQVIFYEKGAYNLTCQVESGKSTTKQVEVTDSKEIQFDDEQEIVIIKNWLSRLPANYRMTIWCLVTNIDYEEKIDIVAYSYLVDEPNIFYRETTSIKGEIRYLGIAEATVTFLETGTFNITCQTESGEVATETVTVEEGIHSKGELDIHISKNGLTQLPATKKVTLFCLVNNMVSEEKIFVSGYNILVDAPNIFYYATTSLSDEKRFLGIAEARVTFPEIGTYNLTCHTQTGGVATETVTVVQDEEIQSNVEMETVTIKAEFSYLRANEKRTVLCLVNNMPSREDISFVSYDYLLIEQSKIFYHEAALIEGEKQYLGIVKATVTFLETGIFDITCQTESGGVASKTMTVVEEELIQPKQNSHEDIIAGQRTLIIGLSVSIPIIIIILCIMFAAIFRGRLRHTIRSLPLCKRGTILKPEEKSATLESPDDENSSLLRDNDKSLTLRKLGTVMETEEKSATLESYSDCTEVEEQWLRKHSPTMNIFIYSDQEPPEDYLFRMYQQSLERKSSLMAQPYRGSTENDKQTSHEAGEETAVSSRGEDIKMTPKRS